MKSNRLPLSGLFGLLISLPFVAQGYEIHMAKYIVKKGDTCASIATALGYAGDWGFLHEYNPGKIRPTLPCKVKPGTVLRYEVRPKAPAKLKTIHRKVEVKTATDALWKEGQVGLDLFRGWMVGTRQASAAEIEFLDSSSIHMRGNTIVIIFGPKTTRKRKTYEVDLKIGSLRASEVVVNTEGGKATFGKGAGIAEAIENILLLSSHEGTATLESTGHGSVKVAEGMGSKVVQGKPPTKPKPLPAAPVWVRGQSGRSIVVGDTGQIGGSWTRVEVAARYRILISLQANGDGPLATVGVHKSLRTFKLEGLEPGIYYARVATVDADGFESKPSKPFKMELVALQYQNPGADEMLAFKKDTSLLVGSKIVVPDGLQCRIGDGPMASTLRITSAGEQSITCNDGKVDLPAAKLSSKSLGVDIKGVPGGQIKLERGIPRRFEVRFAGVGTQLPEGTRIVAHEGLVIETSELTPDGRAVFEITATAETPTKTFVDVVVGEENVVRLIRLEVLTPAIEAKVSTPNEPGAPQASVTNEGFSTLLLPGMSGVIDDVRGGLGGFIGISAISLVAHEPDKGPSTAQSIRIAPGLEANLLNDRLRLVVAHPFELEDGELAKSGTQRHLFSALGWQLQPRNWKTFGVRIEAGAWIPLWDDDTDIRLRPALDFSLEPAHGTVIRMRQGALVDAVADGARLWTSAYALDISLTESMRLGLEGALTSGDEAGGVSVTRFALGMSFGYHTDVFDLTAAPHLALTEDAKQALGIFFATVDIRTHF